jgi:hypothetical protein
MKPERGALLVTILLSAFFEAGYFAITLNVVFDDDMKQIRDVDDLNGGVPPASGQQRRLRSKCRRRIRFSQMREIL